MDLLPANFEIVKLFRIVRNQINENGSPKIGSIKDVFDIYEINIEDRRELFENIMECFNVVFSIENEKDKKEDDK